MTPADLPCQVSGKRHLLLKQSVYLHVDSSVGGEPATMVVRGVGGREASGGEGRRGRESGCVGEGVREQGEEERWAGRQAGRRAGVAATLPLVLVAVSSPGEHVRPDGGRASRCKHRVVQDRRHLECSMLDGDAGVPVACSAVMDRSPRPSGGREG
ncbi:hypothetical protein E2C01_100052 [Portunus trituberculatus]|uniref:Uncharacterized protein n=1 Tax=Portunus trituberculatus TaxID=210409 RepID=A0A5B7KGY8_PORTR|nr:hypothetical protein [Portunus trituberculatus]